MERTLTDKASGKTWSIQQDGNRIFTTGNGGKPKEKTFENPEQAAKHVQKEVWSRLKKGMVLLNPEADAGQPVLHRYIGGGYTGSMPLAPVEDTNTFYCSYVVNQFEKEDVYLLDDQGETRKTYELPGGPMIFDMRFCPELNVLLMNRDHQIIGLSAGNGEVRAYTAVSRHPVSALALSGASAVWYDDPNLVVYDLRADAVRYTRQVTPELYGGHSPQLCAVLSPDGSRMAYCAQSDEIVIVDLATGREQPISKAKQAMTASMSFSPDGRYLFTQEEYGSWSLLAYDVAEPAKSEDWDLGEIKSYAIHTGKNLLAVYKYGKVRLYDLDTREQTLVLDVEHVVKTCYLAFTKDRLAVYTDYGCVSLYALE
ncbi:hypothetical protein PV433_04300 [Paenibacillus sp. GYB004]|uniref:hypothetical protein n=1 Tax=Paenibacillus sp. GYB004 TaxID=2994393 RepID=UPI002F9666A2